MSLQDAITRQLAITQASAVSLAALINEPVGAVANCLRNMERADEVESREIPSRDGRGRITVYRLLNAKTKILP